MSVRKPVTVHQHKGFGWAAWLRGAALAGTAALAACTATPPPKPVVVAPPPPAIIIPPRPVPPGSASTTLLLPARGPDGRFVTLNTGIASEQSLWQMRIALNVAAIGCRGPFENTLIASYNQMLKSHGKAISNAEKRVIADLAKATGTNGIAERDRYATKLYNYFAQPPAQTNFCLKANEVAQLVSTLPGDQLLSTASLSLPQLDQPFIDFYEAYAQYQRDVVAWDARYGPPVTYAAQTPAYTPLAQPGSAPVISTALPPSTAPGSVATVPNPAPPLAMPYGTPVTPPTTTTPGTVQGPMLPPPGSVQ